MQANQMFRDVFHIGFALCVVSSGRQSDRWIRQDHRDHPRWHQWHQSAATQSHRRHRSSAFPRLVLLLVIRFRCLLSLPFFFDLHIFYFWWCRTIYFRKLATVYTSELYYHRDKCSRNVLFIVDDSTNVWLGCLHKLWPCNRSANSFSARDWRTCRIRPRW